MKRILIIQTAFLGDVILATAMVENLHVQFPDARISMLVREGNESLLKEHPFLEQVLVWQKNKGKIRSLISIITQVRKNKFDVVINLQRFFSSGLITALSGADVRSGFDKNPWSFAFTNKIKHLIGDGRHEVDRNAELTGFFCDSKIRKPKLYPSSGDNSKTETYKSKPYIVLAPASVWFTKQLPAEKWVAMIQSASPSLVIYLVGAKSDTTLCESIIKKSGRSNVVNLCGMLNLLQTASLMQDAKMNYVNDSGPLHLASAMNAPVTAFFCSTVPAFGFGPLSDNAVVVQTEETLPCRPCGLHGKKECPLSHFNCAHSIVIPTLT